MATTFSQPLDLMFLEDLSGSFYDDVYTVQTLVPDIVSTIRSYQSDSRFGFASFVDKPISPFGSSYGDYVYRTDLSLTTDTALLQSTVNSLTTGSGNDTPESQIEALMQLALRWEEVGYRIGPVRVVVLMTDAEYHVAGDAAANYLTLPANNGDAVMDGSPAGTGEDYPSLAQLKAVLDATDIYPVFAVTDGYYYDYDTYESGTLLELYQDLVDYLGRGTVVTLSSDSSGLIDTLSLGLEDIVDDFDPDQDLSGTDAPDTIDGGVGNDTIMGGAGDDTIWGGEGTDVIYGDAGDDELDAGTGNDTIVGGAGNDTLIGGEGKDRMEGSTGADTYYVDNKKDMVVEENNDPEGATGLVLDVDLSSTIDTVISSVKYTLKNYVENLTLADSTAKLAGTGNELGNEINGNSGANKISGMAGNDIINGGAGADKLTGGAGADTFLFNDIASGGADAISDFADEDTIQFDTTVFTKLVGATAANFVNGTSAADADDYLIFSEKGGLYYDADGSGSGAAVKIVAIKGSDVKSIAFDDFSFI